MARKSATNTKATNKLPIFDGHSVETQRLKCTGSADKDQWVAVPHEGDVIVYTITKSRVSNVDHKFTEDGVIRIENLHAVEVFADPDDKGRIAVLFKDLSAIEIDVRRENSGKVTLDDAVDEAAAAAAAAGATDQVGAQRAARAGKATKAAKKK